jgi:hypothetical protein
MSGHAAVRLGAGWQPSEGMARMFAAQLARLGRRPGVWLLTGALVILSVLVARHNVDGVRDARADLASTSAGRVVRNCVVYGGYAPLATCPEQTGPLVIQLSGGIAVRDAPSAGGAASSAPCLALFGGRCLATASAPKFSFQVTQRQDHMRLLDDQQIRQAVVVPIQSLDTAARALAPRQRARLALSLLASLPGLSLAVLLGVIAVGRDYRRLTWKARLAVARSEPSRLAAKLAALWLVALGWIGAAVIATLATYAVLAPGAHLAAWGRPAIPLLPLAGTWLGLGLLASLAAAVSAAPRAAGLGTVTGLAHPASEPLAEHE